MDNIVTRAYVKTEKKFLIPTTTGELIVDSLVGKFAFIDLGYTRDIEKELDRVAKGEASYKAVVTQVHEQLLKELAAHQATTPPKYPCPACAKPLRRIQGKSGFFWGCSGHPTCSLLLADKGGEPELVQHKCQKCSRTLVHRTKKGKNGYDFWGCSGFKEGCITSYENKKGAPDFTKTK